MKKLLIMLIVVGMSAGVASAAGGVGVFGSYWDADDPGPGYGGGLKFKAELVDYLAVELRASCITKFDEWDGDDDLFVIPLEAGLVLNFPLGTEVPITIYGGGGVGYAIIPEADDIDFDDDFTFYGVAGAEFALGDALSLFAEAQYRFLEVDGAEVNGEAIKEKVKFTGFGVNVGLMLRF